MTTYSFFLITAMFVLPLLAILIPILLGQQYGIYHSKHSKVVPDAPLGSLVAAVLGLLAFMLAFTFQIVANRYDTRKELLLKEVTTIRTTYLRSGLIPEPYNSNSKQLLIEYVDLRIGLAQDPSKLKQSISRSHSILDTLWNYTEDLAKQDRSSEVYALYTTSINDLVDLQNQRITVALEYRIPKEILVVLFIITFFSMLTLGYQFGINGKKNFTLVILLAIVFAVVMFLILVLDNPELGIAKISQKPMFTLQQQLRVKP